MCFCVLSVALVGSSATHTEQVSDRSGCITLRALEHPFGIVFGLEGEVTTVLILRTSQYRVLNLHEVNNLITLARTAIVKGKKR